MTADLLVEKLYSPHGGPRHLSTIPVKNSHLFKIAKTWALRDGLLLCNWLKFNAVMVELDVKALVDAFKNPSYANTIFSSLFDDCRHLATQIPHLSIKHIYREANRCADCLAILGSCQVVDFISYSCPPVDLLPLVVALGDGCKQALS